MNPAIFHLASILLHALATVFLFQILRLAIKNDLAAIIGALLFALHPIQVESIAFAGVLNVPLSGCLALLAIWQYLVAADPTRKFPRASRQVRWTIAWAALLLALLARPSAVVAAPIALILDVAIHRRPIRSAIFGMLPWGLMVIACVVWTGSIQHGTDAARSPAWFRPVVASDAVTFYLRKIFLPLRLGIEYDRTPQSVREMSLCWLTSLAPISMIAAIILSWRRQPLFAAAIAIFIVGLLPNSGLMPFDWQLVSTVSDRYAYLSVVGVALAIGTMMNRRRGLKYPCLILLAILAIRTEFQISTWRNGETLFRHALTVNPNGWYSQGNLASVIADRSPDEAISFCRSSINLRSDRADVWNTLGSLLMTKGNRTEAISAFQTACRLEPSHPVFTANLARAQKEMSAPGSKTTAPSRF